MNMFPLHTVYSCIYSSIFHAYESTETLLPALHCESTAEIDTQSAHDKCMHLCRPTERVSFTSVLQMNNENLLVLEITPLQGDDMKKSGIYLKYKPYMFFIKCTIQRGVLLLAKITLNQTLASLFIVLKVGKAPFCCTWK